MKDETTKGLLIGASLLGLVFLGSRIFVDSEVDSATKRVWDTFLLEGSQELQEDRQAIFYVLATLYEQRHSETPPSVARMESIRTSGAYDADARAALSHALGRTVRGTPEDLRAYFRAIGTAAPLRELPFPLSDRAHQRLAEIAQEIRRSVA